MNIFVFSPNLEYSACYFFDKDPRRANKQILELTQCLATALHAQEIPVLKKDGTPYKPTHKNHPVVVWLRADSSHLVWACDYLNMLLFRYFWLNRKHHGCATAALEIKDWCVWLPRKEVIPIHHGKGVPRTGDVYKDYREYLEIKLSADRRKRGGDPQRTGQGN